MAEDALLIPVAEAAEKHGIPLKKLIGHVLRGDLNDPIGGMLDGQPMVYDGWRLKKLAQSSLKDV